MRREDDFLRHGSELYERLLVKNPVMLSLFKDSDHALVDMSIRLIETVHFDHPLRFTTDDDDGCRLISCRAEDSLTSILYVKSGLDRDRSHWHMMIMPNRSYGMSFLFTASQCQAIWEFARTTNHMLLFG
jgi:hypothetical protein